MTALSDATALQKGSGCGARSGVATRGHDRRDAFCSSCFEEYSFEFGLNVHSSGFDPFFESGLHLRIVRGVKGKGGGRLAVDQTPHCAASVVWVGGARFRVLPYQKTLPADKCRENY